MYGYFFNVMNFWTNDPINIQQKAQEPSHHCSCILFQAEFLPKSSLTRFTMSEFDQVLEKMVFCKMLILLFIKFINAVVA
jgi:hypothetical protein